VLRPRNNLKSYTLVTAPTTEPVDLATAKLFMRVDGTADDAIITSILASARRMAEEYTKRAFMTQTWRLVMDGFTEFQVAAPTVGFMIAPTPTLVDGSQYIQLSRQPIQSITSIITTDTVNAATTLAAATYTLATGTGRILLNDGYSWPTSLRSYEAVAITFVAGYAGAAAVPEPIKQAILQISNAMYSAKSCADIPDGAKALLDSFRLPEAFGAW
jgi:hypothetical protein